MSLLLPLLAVWLAWAVVIYAGQRRMIFPGRAAAPLAEGESLPGARLHRIELADAQVEAWWLPPTEGSPRPAPAVIFTHGNLELVDEWVGSFEPLRRAGGNVDIAPLRETIRAAADVLVGPGQVVDVLIAKILKGK